MVVKVDRVLLASIQLHAPETRARSAFGAMPHDAEACLLANREAASSSAHTRAVVLCRYISSGMRCEPKLNTHRGSVLSVKVVTGCVSTVLVVEVSAGSVVWSRSSVLAIHVCKRSLKASEDDSAYGCLDVLSRDTSPCKARRASQERTAELARGCAVAKLADFGGKGQTRMIWLKCQDVPR